MKKHIKITKEDCHDLIMENIKDKELRNFLLKKNKDENLTKIKKIDLSQLQSDSITNFNGFNKLPLFNVELLDLGEGHNLCEIKFISNLKNLKIIQGKNIKLYEFEGIEKLKKLEKIDFENVNDWKCPTNSDILKGKYFGTDKDSIDFLINFVTILLTSDLPNFKSLTLKK